MLRLTEYRSRRLASEIVRAEAFSKVAAHFDADA